MVARSRVPGHVGRSPTEMETTNPYSPPNQTARRTLRPRLLRRIRLAAGLMIPVSLLAGVSGTVVGMIRSFNAMARSEAVEPSQLSADISRSLSVGMVSIPIAIAAIVVWLWATVAIRRSPDNTSTALADKG